MLVVEHTLADAPAELLAMWVAAATGAELDARLAAVEGAL